MAAPTGILFYDPRTKPLSTTGNFQPGCYLLFFNSGTTTLANVFADGALTTPLSQVPGTNQPSCTADASGRFVPIYLNPAVIYRVQLFSALGVLLEDTDPFVPASALLPTQAQIGALLYPRTAAEIAAGVIPVNFVYPELDPRRYGVDTTGAVDASAAVIVWLSVAEQYTSVILQYPQAGVCRLDAGIIIDTNKVGIDWNGSKLDFTHLSIPHGIQFTQSTGDVNLRVLNNGAHPISNAYIVGPGMNVDADGMFLNDAISYNLAGLSFKNLNFLNWSTDVTFATGAFCIDFNKCSFTCDLAGVPDLVYSIVIAGGNSGERNTFNNCFWFNRQFHINALSGNSDTYFYNCSLDTFTTSINAQVGFLYFSGCHFENANDTAAWGIATGGLLFIHNSTFVTQSAKTTDFWQSNGAGAGTGTGIFLRDCSLATGSLAITGRLLGGTGPARVDNIAQFPSGARPVIGGTSQNLLAYGDMESTNWALDWSLAGTTLPTRDTTISHGGAASMKIVGIVGQAIAASASARRACRPGQYMQGEMWYQIPAITGSGATFQYSILYCDASGGSIPGTGSTINITTNVATWLHTVLAAVNPAPPGTVSAVFQMILTTPTSGAPVLNVDDMLINTF